VIRSAIDLADQASAVVEPVFTRLGRVVEEVLRCRPSRGAWSESHLTGVQALLIELLGEDSVTAGMGFVAAPGVIDGQDRYMNWWQRRGDRIARLRLNFDPASIDVYDYLQMEWFQLARAGRDRVAFGPYVDYSGSELYTITATVPIRDGGEFLGVAGVDFVVSELERRLIRVLQAAGSDAVLVSAERRVIAANTPRWVVGSRLPALPVARAAGFREVAELAVGTGWVLAVAEPET